MFLFILFYVVISLFLHYFRVMDERDETFINLMPENEKEYFKKRERSANYKFSMKDAQEGLAKMLTGEFVNSEDGKSLSPKDIIDMKMIAFVMANPSPQNGKALYELAGLAAPKQFDFTSGGKSVDSLLASLAIKKDADEEEETDS